MNTKNRLPPEHQLQEWFLQKISILTEQGSLSVDTRIFDLDLSSLEIISLLGDIEETFHVTLDMERLISCETIQSLIQYCFEKTEKVDTPAQHFSHNNIPYHGCYSSTKWKQRVAWLEDYSKQSIPLITQHSLNPESLRGNIENFIGSVEVPLGIAGPLRIQGKFIQDEWIVAPLATSEGALISSLCRGAKAINQSDGVQVHVEGQRMSRAPVFLCQHFHKAQELKQWILSHLSEIVSVAESVSRHAKLVQIDPLCLGKNLYIQFIYQTGDAAGQNMTTACTHEAIQYIVEQFQQVSPKAILHFYIEGALSGDKKVTGLNYQNHRGITVQAHATIPETVLKRILKIESSELLKAYHSGIMASIYSHMSGFNINLANVIAGFFVATGQDIASVHESSIGQFHMEPSPEGLYIMLYLPSLIIGTVGGGTGLPKQQEVLKLLHCEGSGKVFRLAEMIASFALALEVSTISAVVGGQFAAAHERLGRNRPSTDLKKNQLTLNFLNDWIRLPNQQKPVRVEIQELLVTDSILTDISKNNLTHKWVGHLALKLYTEQNKEYSLVVKSKATDQEVIQMNHKLASLISRDISGLHRQFKNDLGFKNCDLREIKIYQTQDPRLKQLMPEIFGTFINESQELFLVAMENLDQPNILLKDTASHPEQWTPNSIQCVLEQLAQFHSLYYESYDYWAQQSWIEIYSKEQELKKRPFWEKVIEHQREEFPDLFSEEILHQSQTFLADYEKIGTLLAEAPKTLIHQDCNTRNLCLKNLPTHQQLILFDWELACIHVPQRDVCEFLAYVITEKTTVAEYSHYVEYYYQKLQALLPSADPLNQFWKIYVASCQEFLLNRLGLYSLVYTFKDYDFFERVLTCHTKLLKYLLKK